MVVTNKLPRPQRVGVFGFLEISNPILRQHARDHGYLYVWVNQPVVYMRCQRRKKTKKIEVQERPTKN